MWSFKKTWDPAAEIVWSFDNKIVKVTLETTMRSRRGVYIKEKHGIMSWLSYPEEDSVDLFRGKREVQYRKRYEEPSP